MGSATNVIMPVLGMSQDSGKLICHKLSKLAVCQDRL
jgi:hypothetical protein